MLVVSIVTVFWQVSIVVAYISVNLQVIGFIRTFCSKILAQLHFSGHVFNSIPPIYSKDMTQTFTSSKESCLLFAGFSTTTTNTWKGSHTSILFLLFVFLLL